MPKYAYRCFSCVKTHEKHTPITKRTLTIPCPTCGETCKQLVPQGVGGVLKGDVWPGKNIQTKNQMKARRDRVGQREKQLFMDGPQTGLVPNVGGEFVDSWDEASKLAKSKGLDTKNYKKRADYERKVGRRPA